MQLSACMLTMRHRSKKVVQAVLAGATDHFVNHLQSGLELSVSTTKSLVTSSSFQAALAISDTCRGDFVSALHGETTPIFEVLLEVNGSSLELHMPKGKAPVLAVFPSEHASHVTWQVPRLEEPNPRSRQAGRRLLCTPPLSSVRPSARVALLASDILLG